jgi:predicted small metal-binding protein
MEKFVCKNFVHECDFVATGETKEEVMQKAMEHGGAMHADLVKGMTEEQMAEFGKKVEASIETV